MTDEPTLTSIDLETLSASLQMDEDQLFAQIGKEVYVSAVLPPLEQLVEQKRKWINGRRDRFRAALCADHTVQALIDGKDEFALAQAIFVALVATMDVGASV